MAHMLSNNQWKNYYVISECLKNSIFKTKSPIRNKYAGFQHIFENVFRKIYKWIWQLYLGRIRMPLDKKFKILVYKINLQVFEKNKLLKNLNKIGRWARLLTTA